MSKSSQTLQTHHVDSTLKRRGNDRFHVVSTWNPRGVFVRKILTQIDKEMKMENWHILLFLDNATSHKECFMCSLTNIKLIFLSKNTMPKVKSLYAAIIRAFKSKYYKMFISLTDEKKKTTEIAEGIDILKATGCLKNA